MDGGELGGPYIHSEEYTKKLHKTSAIILTACIIGEIVCLITTIIIIYDHLK